MSRAGLPIASASLARTRRWLRPAAAAVPMALAAAYGLLPWYVPPAWLARRAERTLSESLGRPVHIEQISLSWTRGVRIRGVRVEDISGAGRPPDLVRIEEMRFALTPLRTVLRRRVNRLEMEGPQLWVSLLPDGHLNIDDVVGAGSLRLPATTFTLRHTILHLSLPDLPAQCRMDRTDIRLDRATGLLRVIGDATMRPRGPDGRPMESAPPSGRFWIDARLEVPRLKKGVHELRGGGELRWENVDLREIPFRRLPRLGLDRIEGRSNGVVRLEAFPDLGVDFEHDVSFTDLAVYRRDRAAPERLEDSSVRASGHWDPAADTLVVKTLEYRMGALRLRDAGRPDRPALVADARAPEPLRLELQGEVIELDELRRKLPPVDDWLTGCGLRIGGSCSFSIAYAGTLREVVACVSVDAAAAQVSCGERLNLAAGLPKRIHAEIRRARPDGPVVLDQGRIEIGDLRASVQGTIPWEAAGAGMRGRLAGADLHLGVSTDHMESLWGYLPSLARLDGWDGTGPAEAGLSWSSAAGTVRCVWTARVDGQGAVRAGRYLRKPRGVALAAEGRWEWDLRQGRCREMDVRARVGSGALRVLGDGARIEAMAWVRQDDGAVAQADLRARLPVTISGVEHMVACSPVLAEVMNRAEVSAAGDLALVLDGSLSYRPGDWAWHMTADADLTTLEMRVGQAFRKEAGQGARVRVSQRFVRVGGEVEDEYTLYAAIPGVSVRASHARTASAGASEATAERAQLEIDMADARVLRAGWPMIDDHLGGIKVAGGAAVRIESSRVPGRQEMRLDVMADGLDVAAGGSSGWRKAAGLPARLAIEAAGDREEWVVQSGTARLAGCEVTVREGRITFGPQGCEGGTGQAALWARPVLDRIEATGSVVVTADGQMRSIAPSMRRLLDRAGLNGRVEGWFRAELAAGELNLEGGVEAGAAAFAVDAPGVGRVVKPTGVDAGISFDVRRCGGWVEVREAAIRSAQNRIDMSGWVEIGRASGRVTVDHGRVWAGLTLRRLDLLQALLPDQQRPRLRGAMLANAVLTARQGRWDIDPGDAILRDVTVESGDRSATLDGQIELTGGEVVVDSLAVRMPTGVLQVSGRAGVGNRPEVRMGVTADRLDVDELRALWRAVEHEGISGRVAAGARDGRRIWDALSRSAVDLRFEVGELALTIPELNLRTRLPAAGLAASGEEGVVRVPLRASAAGGVVEGEIELRLAESPRHFDLRYTATGLEPGPLVQAYLRRSFPGMVATGPLMLIDRSLQRLEVAAGEANWPVGSGEMIIEGGTVEGKAAPDWMTRIFPGLNLARYDFVRMHDWFTKHADGRIEHRMIFQGRYYHLYMEGYTDAARNIRYEVGIDLLARLDSKYWVETRTGRIPLFIKSGRLAEDGTLDPDIVQFTPLRRVIESLVVQNNVARAAYLAIKKQVLVGGK